MVWVDYPDCGEMFRTQAWAWLARDVFRASVRSRGVEVGSGDWHCPSQSA